MNFSEGIIGVLVIALNLFWLALEIRLRWVLSRLDGTNAFEEERKGRAEVEKMDEEYLACGREVGRIEA